MKLNIDSFNLDIDGILRSMNSFDDSKHIVVGNGEGIYNYNCPMCGSSDIRLNQRMKDRENFECRNCGRFNCPLPRIKGKSNSETIAMIIKGAIRILPSYFQEKLKKN